MAQHKAAYIDKPKAPLRIASTETKRPGPGEVLVKVRAVAINPVDWSIQDHGIFIKEWPFIPGEDAAGEVVEIGDGVIRFSKGQNVIVHSQTLRTGKYEQSAFQELLISPQESLGPLPDSISHEAGAVLPLSISTAAAGLFQPDHLGLNKPSTSPKHNGKVLLVWGGSSSVGASTIQLAVAAGYDIVTTASESNFGFVKGLGAKEVFDYHSEGLAGKLLAVLKGRDLVGVYDAIGSPESTKKAAEVLDQLGGGRLTSTRQPPSGLPTSVTATGLFAVTIFSQHKEVGKAVWEDFLPVALESGQFKPAPGAEVVGKGLDALQGALDKQKAGVSAKKIVVSL